MKSNDECEIEPNYFVQTRWRSQREVDISLVILSETVSYLDINYAPFTLAEHSL